MYCPKFKLFDIFQKENRCWNFSQYYRNARKMLFSRLPKNPREQQGFVVEIFILVSQHMVLLASPICSCGSDQLFVDVLHHTCSDYSKSTPIFLRGLCSQNCS
uniref:Uncharacterized protein n=1 Tax=Sphaerodactylus townsendi TaxID=933632 RepID=A0ACB8FUM7_9SAUR